MPGILKKDFFDILHAKKTFSGNKSKPNRPTVQIKIQGLEVLWYIFTLLYQYHQMVRTRPGGGESWSELLPHPRLYFLTAFGAFGSSGAPLSLPRSFTVGAADPSAPSGVAHVANQIDFDLIAAKQIAVLE